MQDKWLQHSNNSVGILGCYRDVVLIGINSANLEDVPSDTKLLQEKFPKSHFRNFWGKLRPLNLREGLTFLRNYKWNSYFFKMDIQNICS